MCVKLPALFTKAYNRMLAEQQLEILQGRLGNYSQDNVFEYGTFAKASEWMQLQSDKLDVPHDLKNEDRLSVKMQNLIQFQPIHDQESTAITKNIYSRPSAR